MGFNLLVELLEISAGRTIQLMEHISQEPSAKLPRLC